MRYFALLDTEEVVLIGEYRDISEAMDDEPGNTHWVLSEEGLLELGQQIKEALK